MKAKRNCPLCGNCNVDLIESLNFIGNKEINNLPEIVNIVICNSCSLVYNDMYSSQKEFDNYYINHSSYNESFNALHTLVNKDYYKDIVYFLEKHIDIENSIVDIGCGNGIFLEKLYENGYKNITGIDASESFINNKYNIEFISDSIFLDNVVLKKKYDVITIISVLEHIFDANTILNNINKSINENGILYIDVPYIRDYQNRFNLSIEHINHFSKKSIVNLAKLYGYNIIDMRIRNFYDCDHIQVILKKSNISNNLESYIDGDIDSIVVENYKDFIDKINSDINYNLIYSLKINKEKVILWGIAGTILPILPILEKLNIIAIVDASTNKHGKKILKHSIIAPNEIKDENATILILSQYYYDVIYNQIKEMGLKNKVEFLTNRTEQNRTEQNRTEQNRTEQNRTEQIIYKKVIYKLYINNTTLNDKLQPMLQDNLAA